MAAVSFDDMNAAIVEDFGIDCSYVPQTATEFAIVVVPEDPSALEAWPQPVNMVALVNRPDFGSTVPETGDHLIVMGSSYIIVTVDYDLGAGVTLGLRKEE